MKAQRNGRDISRTPKGRKPKLLLVDCEYELGDSEARRMFGGGRPWITSRSTSLLGALKRLRSETIDLVLLSHKFQAAEVALFIADARREGFSGLILRVASILAPGSDSSGDSSPADPSLGLIKNPPHPPRMIFSVRGQDERWNASISLTARQRDVLTLVSEGWTNMQVGRQLKCTEGAVKATLQALFRKLGVRKRSQIVRIAFEKGLVDAPGKGAGLAYPERELTYSPASWQGKEPIHAGDFVMDLAMHRIWVRGVETHLTPSEFQLLAVLMMHPGELVTGSSLREMFWRNPTARQNSLRVLVGGLRAKIEEGKTPRYLVTERNLGYRLIPSPSHPETGA